MIYIINSKNVFFLFLFLHLMIWTIVPTISNVNLPLDTIEALAWASNPDWGYNKHPPMSAFVVGTVFNIFKNSDWIYYLLSQIFVIISFFYVYKLSSEFFQKKTFTLLSVLILETVVFFNYTTPEFNVYVCQLPIKAITVYFFWRSIKYNNFADWLVLGSFSALGVLTHYSFFFLILSLLFFFIFFVDKTKKGIIKNFIFSAIFFLIFITPHIVWLFENNFITINYAFGRTGIENNSFVNHLFNPFIFLIKQLGMLAIFIGTFFSILSLKKKRIYFKNFDKKKLFLVCITILPIVFVLLVSLITGARIRTMWMSSFYLFIGILFFYFFKEFINFKKINRFLFLFLIIFILSPLTYLYISLSNDFKRTDYPGKEISNLVQNKWDKNFVNEIEIVIGDEWSAGNLSYHLKSRPTWFNELKDGVDKIGLNQGVIYTGNPKVLEKVCPGVYGTIKPIGYCMIGQK